MKVEYELDQWEWQGTTRSIDVDPEDYEGMTEAEADFAGNYPMCSYECYGRFVGVL